MPEHLCRHPLRGNAREHSLLAVRASPVGKARAHELVTCIVAGMVSRSFGSTARQLDSEIRASRGSFTNCDDVPECSE